MSPSARSTYSMIVSSLALVVALGGTGAYAAHSVVHLTKNSVTSKQIKDGTIQAGDLKKGELTGAQVKDGSLTGADVDSSTLGKVSSAATVDTVTHFAGVATVSPASKVTIGTRGQYTFAFACATTPSIGNNCGLTVTPSQPGSRFSAEGAASINMAAGAAQLVASCGPFARHFAVSLLGPNGGYLEISGSISLDGNTGRADMTLLG
jgi:hypothetical protein